MVTETATSKIVFEGKANEEALSLQLQRSRSGQRLVNGRIIHDFED